MIYYMVESEVMIGWTTLPTKEDAQRIITRLVEMDLVACGQVSDPIESYYKWNGKMEKNVEWKVTLKYSSKKYNEVTQEIKNIHPYEVPQWVSVEVKTSEVYKKWVNQC